MCLNLSTQTPALCGASLLLPHVHLQTLLHQSSVSS